MLPSIDLGTGIGNRRIILNANQNNGNQFNGFGFNNTGGASNLRYQIDSTFGNHIFYEDRLQLAL